MIVAEEVIIDRDQEEGLQVEQVSPQGQRTTSCTSDTQLLVEDTIPEEHLTTLVAVGISPVLDVSSAQKTSSSSRHYAKLTYSRVAQLSTGFPAPCQLSCTLCQTTWGRSMTVLSAMKNVHHEVASTKEGHIK